jgi:N-glycosylase/DNA lyase
MNPEQLREQFELRKDEIRARLDDFSNPKMNDIFYEMCFCILTPQSNAKKCWNAVLELKEKDFLHKGEINVEFILKSNTRFHNNKSKYIELAKSNFKEIFNKIFTTTDSKELRLWLVDNIKGYSFKEASHFLRNIGYKNLAILDRHILKNIILLGMIPELPKTLTKNRYLEIEDKISNYCEDIEISMDELDLLLWSIEAGEVFK